MTSSKIILIQRFYPNFREGLFDRLYQSSKFELICHQKSYGKIKTPSEIGKKEYVLSVRAWRIFEDYIFFPTLFFSLIQKRPSIIVTEGGKNTINNLVVLVYCKIFSKEFIVWDLGKRHLKNKKKNFLHILYLKLQKYILKRAKKIFTYNEVNKEYFHDLNLNREIVALGNTVDTKKIIELNATCGQQIKDVPQSIMEKGKIFLYIGALNETKKVHDLPKLLRLTNDFGLIVIGDGKPAYKEKLKESFGKMNYVMVGYKTLEQLPPYYAISNLVILPGLGGLTIPQSYMFKTPVLCSIADGAEQEIIENNVNGFIYNEFLEAQGFINDTDILAMQKMGERGFRTVSSRFSIERYSSRFLESIK